MNEPVPDTSRAEDVAGERGIPSVNRIRSMQSRVTSLLAVSFVSLMALGLMAWYYVHAWQHSQAARERAQNTNKQRTQGEMRLPPLGRIQPPRPKTAETKPNEAAPEASTASVWGSPPPLPPTAGSTTSVAPTYPIAYRSQVQPAAGQAVAAPPMDRRLTGPVLSQDGSGGTNRAPSRDPALEAHREPALWTPSAPAGAAATASGTDTLADLLRPTATPATLARVLPTQRLLLPKGAFVDCTLETALDSSLRGMVTCVTPTDIFGADGTTVLLERGTKLTGETRGEARQGLARVYVLWTEARTPAGIVAMLDSPGTDELGRSGLPGTVNRHFAERFGAAFLVSIIEGAIQRASRPSDGGTVILNPSATESIATETLKSTVNIPPTILKQNGERIQILVARDLDFRSVYDLRPTAAR